MGAVGLANVAGTTNHAICHVENNLVKSVNTANKPVSVNRLIALVIEINQILY